MRPTPRHIDKKNRLFDYFVIAFFPFFLLHTISLFLSLAVGPVLAILYARYTADKPDGYLIHKLYQAGFQIKPLINRKIRRLGP